MNHVNPRRRRGVVLLIVLGMLSLFTVLVISFVVFSSQMARTSASNNELVRTELPVQESVDSMIRQIVAGTGNPKSALYRESLLEDMYGIDGLQMRVGHRRGNVNRANRPLAPSIPGGMLLLPVPRDGSGNIVGQPETTLFKFPTNLVPWFDDNAQGNIANAPGSSTLSDAGLSQFHVDVRPDLDDAFAGRLVTFDEGPLAGITFRAMRSFSNRAGEPPTARLNNPEPVAPPPPGRFNRNDRMLPLIDPDYSNGALYNQDEYNLNGCLVIDLAEMSSESVEIDGRSQQLYDVADAAPNALLYAPGPDGRPGQAGVDDNGNGITDDPAELGTLNSDDYGYRFTLNGVPFNGRGKNPSGLAGVTSNNQRVLDSSAAIELQLNSALMGLNTHAGPVVPGPAAPLPEAPQPDEQWDAPGPENVFLAWQPSDHRRVYLDNLPRANRVYTGANADELNRNLGSLVIPSFHRPSIINYLMNAPIVLQTDNPTQPGYIPRNFATIRNAPSLGAPNFDEQRLRVLVESIRRATLRPLNVSHVAFANQFSDLDGDGIPFDGSPGFSGSNPAPIMSQTVDLSRDITNVANFQAVADEVYRLALWLVNGPWDVDNDGDGLPDSVWVDLGLQNSVAPDGTLIRPLSAILIEDLDGKINVNHSGSFAQLLERTLIDGPYNTGAPSFEGIRRYYSEGQYFSVARSQDSFGFGGGVGPAEINFSHLFSDFDPRQTISPYPNNFNGPLTVSQLGPQLSLTNVFNAQPLLGSIGLLRTRYGNLINVRQGGEVYDYTGNQFADYPQPVGTKFPAAGDNSNAQLGTSVLSRIPFPARPEIPVLNSPVSSAHASQAYSSTAAIGRPVDINGLMRTRKDSYGEHEFSRPLVANEVFNQPYEAGATEVFGDDSPFSVAEYIDFIRGGPLGGRLAQLLGDAADRNKSLTRLLATESRSVESPEIPGVSGFVQLLSSKLRLHQRVAPPPPDADAQRALSYQQSHIDRMVAVELRKGSKLNLNRRIGNGSDNNNDAFVDDGFETGTQLIPPTGANQPNNRSTREAAFPQIAGTYPIPVSMNPPGPAGVNANYSSSHYAQATFGGQDFDGIDIDGDGILDVGTPFDLDGDGNPDEVLKIASGGELLARHLYVLMFTLLHNPDSNGVLIPDFPYPNPNEFSDAAARNRYAARRIAQWAVNAVDYRDTDCARTRFRYDPNPFDGFDPGVAANHTIWGMERPEIEITEAIAFHDKRTRRELMETGTEMGQVSSDIDPDSDMDGDPTTGTIPDPDMDQFRIPQATAIIELHSLRSPLNGNPALPGTHEPSLPAELYLNNQLHLGRTTGSGNAQSPVWRIAVGAPTDNNVERSTRWLYGADRIAQLIADDGARIDELSYLNNGVDMGDPMQSDPSNAGSYLNQNWNAGQRQSAEVVHVPRPATAGTEVVQIADPDFDPTNGSPHRIALERFAWFANLSPDNDLDPTTPPTLHVVDQTRGSAMRPDNVYFNREQLALPGQTALTPVPGGALLPLGGYAVLAPRGSTILGQTSAASAIPSPYSPANQRFEFDTNGAAGLFRLKYYDQTTANNQPAMTPPYAADDATQYRVGSVLPIICESLLPHQVSAAGRPDWLAYTTNYGADERVDMGFNISAPLPGDGYYPAPTQRIESTYPLVDGYRDYDGGNGLHPDVPFDQDPVPPPPAVRPPVSMTASAPLYNNSYIDPDGSGVTIRWNFIGTHQEACTVFLQRLADPTQPWHAIDNPYLTEDFIPIDLTTFNGEGDVKQPVDRDGDGDPTNDNYFADSGRVTSTAPFVWEQGTLYDGPTDRFSPPVKMDSRRKIPDVRKDRVATKLLRNASAANTMTNYVRAEIVKRSPLSATFSVLRESPTPPGTDIWPYAIGSIWVNQNFTESTDPFDTSHSPQMDPFSPGYSSAASLDGLALRFTQTLGFVNREYGFPVRFDEQQIGIPDVSAPVLPLAQVNPTFYVGSPQGVEMTTVEWLDRDYQSPFDIMNVPASSRTGILTTFTPGTTYFNLGEKNREAPNNFGHLLGFDYNFDRHRPEDLQFDNPPPTRPDPTRLPLGFAEPVEAEDQTFEQDFDLFTGDKPGFEQIFDYVDTGPVWFDSQRWIDPEKVLFRNDQFLSGQTLNYQQRARLFNRAVTTLQPPYNYIGKHRTPGRVNLNTTPDYIRKGPGFGANLNEFLDAGETPEQPDRVIADQTNPVPSEPYIFANPYNDNVDENGFTFEFRGSSAAPNSIAPLFGNGSVHRSLQWGSSTPYELDADLDSASLPLPFRRVHYGAPSVHGINNFYEQTVDSPFGRSFKAFIESRRGYHSSVRAPLAPGLLPTDLGNPDLDWRYPTRFAGAFGTARSSALGSVQRFMRAPDESGIGVIRRTDDMGLLRPHPDFDERLITSAQRNAHANPPTTASGNPWPFSLGVEVAAETLGANDGNQGGGGDVTAPGPTKVGPAGRVPSGDTVNDLRMSVLRTRLFERPQAELHSNYRGLDRDSFFKYQSTARLANLTTGHSNVYLIRMTTSFFVVDPTTGAVGAEYLDSTGEPVRAKATFVVDRSIPVGFLPGKPLNTMNTVIYSEVTQ